MGQSCSLYIILARYVLSDPNRNVRARVGDVHFNQGGQEEYSQEYYDGTVYEEQQGFGQEQQEQEQDHFFSAYGGQEQAPEAVYYDGYGDGAGYEEYAEAPDQHWANQLGDYQGDY